MKKLFSIIKRFTQGVNQSNIQAHAASSAFYMFLALVPFIAALTSVIPFTGLDSSELLGMISPYIPDELTALISDIVSDIYFASGTVLPLSILISIWLASRSFSSLIRGIEDIYRAPHYSSFIRRSIISCIFTLIMLAAMIAVPTIIIFGERFVRLRVGVLIAFLLLSLLFFGLYHRTPGMKLPVTALIPGAVFSGAVWLLFSWLYSLFARIGGGYSIYGGLAAIIISLLWMYWCMFIILLGAYINVFVYGERNPELPGELI